MFEQLFSIFEQEWVETSFSILTEAEKSRANDHPRNMRQHQIICKKISLTLRTNNQTHAEEKPTKSNFFREMLNWKMSFKEMRCNDK